MDRASVLAAPANAMPLLISTGGIARDAIEPQLASKKELRRLLRQPALRSQCAGFDPAIDGVSVVSIGWRVLRG